MEKPKIEDFYDSYDPRGISSQEYNEYSKALKKWADVQNSDNSQFKDFIGQSLKIGDECIYITPSYKTFSRGRILYFTPKNVKLIKLDKQGKEIIDRWGANTILQSSLQLIRVNVDI